MTTATTSYDEVPYLSHPFPQSHPDRLATLATVFGLSPPPVDQCRVLELGCAAGGNLLPLAVAFPKSRFLGVDLSVRQINDGQQTLRALGLTNAELRQASILDIDATYGQFDYVIVHGVFSWVARDVQEKIFDVCRHNLAPNGVAYISYNTYPGWHMYGMLRDMMLFHASRFPDPKQQVSQARGLLAFLDQWVPEKDDPYGILLRKVAEQLRDKGDWYLYHDHLEKVNDPVYFHQFVDRARAHKLQFLGEADLAVMATDTFPAELANKLKEVAPTTELREQYLDFLRNRTFRQSLLVHQDAKINRTVTPAILAGFRLAATLRPTAEPVEVVSRQSVEFRNAANQGVTTDAPLVKAALLLLAEAWPASVPFSELYHRAWERCGKAAPRPLAEAIAAGQVDALELARLAYNLVTRRLLELHLTPDRFTLELSPRPVASPLARHQALSSKTVTNLRHETIPLGDFDHQLIRLLDGTRSQENLIEALCEVVKQGVLVPRENDQPVTNPAKQRQIIAAMLQRNLPIMARRALIMA